MAADFSQLIAAIKAEQRELAEGSMRFPKSDPFDHGVSVGKFQGLDSALQILDSILNDAREKESS